MNQQEQEIYFLNSMVKDLESHINIIKKRIRKLVKEVNLEVIEK